MAKQDPRHGSEEDSARPCASRVVGSQVPMSRPFPALIFLIPNSWEHALLPASCVSSVAMAGEDIGRGLARTGFEKTEQITQS